MDVSIALAIPEGYSKNPLGCSTVEFHSQSEFSCMEGMHGMIAERTKEYHIWLFVADLMLNSQGVSKLHYEVYLNGLNELSKGNLTWSRRKAKEWAKKLKGRASNYDYVAPAWMDDKSAWLSWERKVEWHDEEYDEYDTNLETESFQLHADDLGYLVHLKIPALHGPRHYVREKWASSLTQMVRYPYFSFEDDRTSKGRLMNEWYDEIASNPDIENWEAISLMPFIASNYSHDMHNDYIIPFLGTKTFIPNIPEIFSTPCQEDGRTLYGDAAIIMPYTNYDIINNLRQSKYKEILVGDNGVARPIDCKKAYIDKDLKELEKIHIKLIVNQEYELSIIKEEGDRPRWSVHSSDIRKRMAKNPLLLFEEYLKEKNIRL